MLPTYGIAEGVTLVSSQVCSQAGGYEGPVAVQLEDVDVVNGAVCGPIAYEVTLQHRTILAAVNMRTSLAVAGVWV